MRLSRPLLTTLILAAALHGAPPAVAQTAGAAPTAADEERRTKLFKEGKAAADAGQWLEAADRFRKVVAIRGAPKAYIALGVAEEHLGHLVAALTAYKQAREGAADKTLTDELRTANAALEQLRPRVPKLLFSLSDAAARIEVDGVAVKLDDGALLVDPGDHAILVTSSGRGTFRTTASVKEGDSRQVDVVFDASGAPTATATSTVDVPAGPAPKPPTGALVIGIAGVVAAGVGGALYGLGAGQYGDADKKCPGAACTQDVVTGANGARAQMIAGDALMAAGALMLAGAGVWWIVSATSKKDAATSVFIAPRIGGIGVGGRF
ncbi:MAG: hypothetical protein U0441_34630 [Polyangiaceae bacterium]